MGIKARACGARRVHKREKGGLTKLGKKVYSKTDLKGITNNT